MKTPIRTRLTVTYCAVFWISAILLECGAYAGLQSSICAVVDSELQLRLNGVVGFLTEHVGRKTLGEIHSELETHEALNPEFLQIDLAGQGRIHQGRSMIGLSSGNQAGAPSVLRATNAVNTPLRLLSARRSIRGKIYDLRLGDNFTVPAEILRRFRWLAFLSSPILFAGAAIAGHLVSKRALEPVSRLTKTARSIGAYTLGERVAVPDSGDELQDLAETLNEMLGRIESSFRHVTQFTANASHELRTPLALIRATAEVALLRRNGNADHYCEALHRILREAERNTTLLDEMLSLARADASVNSIVLKPVEFQPHMENIYERILPLALEKGVRLEYGESESGFWVLADPEHLKRLWLILFDNAIRYTPAGGAIRVSWHAVSSECLSCEISDTGIGISADDLPHIFERFFRADKARSREEGGAGLGLALARWIVEAHHATLEVESRPGQGSTFRVVLAMSDRSGIIPGREPAAAAIAGV